MLGIGGRRGGSVQTLWERCGIETLGVETSRIREKYLAVNAHHDMAPRNSGDAKSPVFMRLLSDSCDHM